MGSYALYGEVDRIYGLEAYDAHDGFNGAQSAMNVVETLGYTVYLALVWRNARKGIVRQGRGAPAAAGWLAQGWEVGGRPGRLAVLVGFATSVMTVSKTVLYWLNEYFSGFENIGHNTASRLLFLLGDTEWNVIVMPSYMLYVFGAEIMQGLAYGEKGVKRQ